MKSYVFAGSVAVLAGLLTWSFDVRAPDDVDPITSGSIRRDGAHQQFSMANSAAKTSCIAERGGAVSGRSRSFTAPADCNSVWPGLAEARTWTENEDGSVSLANGRGEAVLTVSNDDGSAAYQAQEPTEAPVTVLAIN